MKYREIIDLVAKDGWVLKRTTGSHSQYQHPTKKGTVTIAGQLGNDVPNGTRISILKQAGLR